MLDAKDMDVEELEALEGAEGLPEQGHEVVREVLDLICRSHHVFPVYTEREGELGAGEQEPAWISATGEREGDSALTFRYVVHEEPVASVVAWRLSYRGEEGVLDQWSDVMARMVTTQILRRWNKVFSQLYTVAGLLPSEVCASFAGERLERERALTRAFDALAPDVRGGAVAPDVLIN